MGTSLWRRLGAIILIVVVLGLCLVPAAAAAPEQASANAPSASCAPTYYRICYGDTLANIVWRYGVTVGQLQQWNGIPNPNLIYAGRTLVIYRCSYPAPQPPPNLCQPGCWQCTCPVPQPPPQPKPADHAASSTPQQPQPQPWQPPQHQPQPWQPPQHQPNMAATAASAATVAAIRAATAWAVVSIAADGSVRQRLCPALLRSPVPRVQGDSLQAPWTRGTLFPVRRCRAAGNSGHFLKYQVVNLAPSSLIPPYCAKRYTSLRVGTRPASVRMSITLMGDQVGVVAHGAIRDAHDLAEHGFWRLIGCTRLLVAELDAADQEIKLFICGTSFAHRALLCADL